MSSSPMNHARLHGRVGAQLGEAGQSRHGQLRIEAPALVDIVFENWAGDPGRELIPRLSGVPGSDDLLGCFVGLVGESELAEGDRHLVITEDESQVVVEEVDGPLGDHGPQLVRGQAFDREAGVADVAGDHRPGR